MQYDKDQQSGLNDDETNRRNGRRTSQKTMKKAFAVAFLQKRKEKEDQWSRASSRSRKFDFHAKSNWNLVVTTLPSYETNTMPLLETDEKKW